MRTPRLMAVLAHPDDESLGGTLAKYASAGIEVFLTTATRGDSGRFRGFRLGDDQHHGRLALAKIREGELRAAASALGVREVSILDYPDQELDRAAPTEVVANIAGHIRRVQPNIVLTPIGLLSSSPFRLILGLELGLQPGSRPSRNPLSQKWCGLRVCANAAFPATQ